MSVPPAQRVSPWTALGMRGNPFRRLHEAELAASLLSLDAPDDRAPILALLDAAEQVVQVVGETGWGKSTHLRACHHVASAERRTPCEYTYVPLGTSRLGLPRAPLALWFLDEVQRVRRTDRLTAWKWAARSGLRLMLGSHEDLRAEITAAGLTVRHVALQTPDARAVVAFVERRVRLAGGDSSRVRVAAAAIDLLAACRNFHQIEGTLYEAAQNAVEQAVPGTPLVVDAAGLRAALARTQAVS